MGRRKLPKAEKGVTTSINLHPSLLKRMKDHAWKVMKMPFSKWIVEAGEARLKKEEEV